MVRVLIRGPGPRASKEAEQPLTLISQRLPSPVSPMVLMG